MRQCGDEESPQKNIRVVSRAGDERLTVRIRKCLRRGGNGRLRVASFRSAMRLVVGAYRTGQRLPRHLLSKRRTSAFPAQRNSGIAAFAPLQSLVVQFELMSLRRPRRELGKFSQNGRKRIGDRISHSTRYGELKSTFRAYVDRRGRVSCLARIELRMTASWTAC